MENKNVGIKVWSPVARSLLEEFDGLMNAVFAEDFEPVSRLPSTLVSSAFPPADIYVDEGTGNLHLDLAVAGYSEKDIDIRHENDYLFVEISSKNVEGKKFIQKGIRTSHIKVKYFVPSSKYDAFNSKGVLKDGILSIEIPVKESAKPVRILIGEDK